MGTIIYFEEDKTQHGVIRFVSGYAKKRWFRKERISYSFSAPGDISTPYSEETIEHIKLRIKRDFPLAKIGVANNATIEEKYKFHRFWLIARWDSKERFNGYYSGSMNRDKSPEWTFNIENADIGLDRKSTEQTVDNIRKATGERVSVMEIYLDLVNELLTPIFMITCTSKRSNKETKYFARLEGNRLRLVGTSDAAHKFTYEEVLAMHEHLVANNKNFLYAVLPQFKHNVHYKKIEDYMREMNVSRMVQLDMKLKWINR